jgi:hypothetical protein
MIPGADAMIGVDTATSTPDPNLDTTMKAIRSCRLPDRANRGSTLAGDMPRWRT